MYRINLKNLLFTLDNLGKIGEIIVEKEISKNAKLALDRMLELKLFRGGQKWKKQFF